MTTATRTPTRTSAHTGRLLIRVERRNGRSVVSRAEGHTPYAARLVASVDGRARVMLVQTIAGPLAGDRLRVELDVGPGAALELAANAATLALPAARPARVELHARLEGSALLVLAPEPVILAAGCKLETTTGLELANGAAAIVRELLVLGRHGERPGRYHATLRAELDGRPLLHDAVALSGARVYGSIALLGLAPTAAPGLDELELAGPGRVARVLGADVPSVRRRIESLFATYLRLLAA